MKWKSFYRTSAVLTVSTLIAIGIFLGCGGGGGNQEVDEVPSGEASVTGFVFTINPTFIVADPADALRGSSPAIGAKVRLVPVESENEEAETLEVRTAVDGSFSFVDAPTGLGTIGVFLDPNADPATATPDAEANVIVVEEAVVKVNERFAISREAAFERIRSEIPPFALVYETHNPLPAGSHIFSTVQEFTVIPLTEEDDPSEDVAIQIDRTPLRILQAAEWLFLVDLDPIALDSHPTAYIFVNAQTGEEDVFLGLLTSPVVNDTRLFHDFGRSEIPAGGGDLAVPWPESVVQVPVLDSNLRQIIAEAKQPIISSQTQAITRSVSVNDTPGIIRQDVPEVQVVMEEEGENIFVVVIDSISTEGFGSREITAALKVKFEAEGANFFSIETQVDQAAPVQLGDSGEPFLDANDKVVLDVTNIPHVELIKDVVNQINERADNDERSTLVIFIYAHGIRDPAFAFNPLGLGSLLQKASIKVGFDIGEYGGIQFSYPNGDYVDSFGQFTDPLRGLKACRLRIIIESCYAEEMQVKLEKRFNGRTRSKYGGDLQIYSTSDLNSTSKGPIYTRRFAKIFEVVGADFNVNVADLESKFGIIGVLNDPTHEFRTSVDEDPADGFSDLCPPAPTGGISGTYGANFTVDEDPSDHESVIGLTDNNPRSLTVTVDGDNITVSGSDPFVDVSGSIDENDSFSSSGIGTVAGNDNVTVFMSGTFNNGAVSGTYSMGGGGGLPGGQPVSYDFTANKQ